MLVVERPRDIYLPGASMQPQVRPELLIQPGESLTDALLRRAIIFAGSANTLYDKGREKIGGTATTQINLVTDTIKAALVTTGYTVNAATHEFYSDLGANVVGTDQTLTTKTNVAGVFDADDPTWAGAAVPPSSATQIAYIALYKSTGVAGTSPLIGVIDSATNLPLTPNGGSVTVTWANTANRIFKL